MILVTLGLVLAPLGLALAVVKVFNAIFIVETWKTLTTPGQPAYHPLWAPALIFELVVNATLCIWAIALLWPFFKRKRRFPRYYIAFCVTIIAFVLADFGLTQRIPAASDIDLEALWDIIKPAMTCLIWVPYFIVSKRVAATFVF